MKEIQKKLLAGLVIFVVASFMVLPLTVQGLSGVQLEPQVITGTKVDCSSADLITGAINTACTVLSVVNILIFIVELLAIVYFIWSVVKYMTAGGDPTAASEARKAIMMSLLGLAAIFGAQILINAVAKAIGIDLATTGIKIPFLGI